MKIKPLGDKVVLKQMESEEKTKSGIVLPDTAKEKPQEGEVIAVGPGKIVDGKKVSLDVKVGDKVIYKKYEADDIKIDNIEYLILKEDGILAIIG